MANSKNAMKQTFLICVIFLSATWLEVGIRWTVKTSGFIVVCCQLQFLRGCQIARNLFLLTRNILIVLIFVLENDDKRRICSANLLLVRKFI